MKLELKHLAGYLPYGLQIQNGKEYDIVTGYDNGRVISVFRGNLENFTSLEYVKPILHPLSDLTKEIEVNGEKFVPVEKLFGSSLCMQGFIHYINDLNNGFELTITKGNKTFYADFIQYQKLLEWHFDIYGLIENGLAIDINTLHE